MSTYDYQTAYKSFALSSEKIIVDRDKALKILLSKKKRKIYDAEIIDDKIHITHRYLTCPYCGKRIPAYEKWDYERASMLKEKILSLCDVQMTLFPSRRIRYISFNKALAEGDKVLCPHCDTYGVISNEKISYKIKSEQNLLIVSRKLSGIFDISSMRWLPNITLSFDSEECFETVCFDMKCGEVHVLLECADRVLARTRVYSSRTLGSRDPWMTMLDNKRIFTEIKRAFCSCYGEIPFSSKELDFDKLILLIQFIGYSSEFFNELPLNINNSDRLLCEDFDDIGKKLRFSADVPTVLLNTEIPMIKSVKRCIYSRPSLLLYAAELMRLWRIVENAGLFCGLLKCRYIFVILSFLHQYWSVDEFLMVLRKKKGALWLCNKLQVEDENRLFTLGVEYYSSNDRTRRIIIDKVIKDENHTLSLFEHEYNEYIDYSIPMPLPKEITKTQSINDYQFVCLSSTKAYSEVSQALKNSMDKYTPYCMGVAFSVAKGKRIVAAVEVYDNRVVGALCRHNRPIVSWHLIAAIKKWAKNEGYSLNKYLFETMY